MVTWIYSHGIFRTKPTFTVVFTASIGLALMEADNTRYRMTERSFQRNINLIVYVGQQCLVERRIFLGHKRIVLLEVLGRWMRLGSTLDCTLICGKRGIVGSEMRLIIFAGAPDVPL